MPDTAHDAPTRRGSPRRRTRAAVPVAAAALIAAGAAALPATPATAAGSVVKVTGTQGNWQLQVDGSPYQVKGLTWGPSPADAEQYMPDLASMGVNTIRTWGTDATSQPLLDSAAAHGIKVIAGFWLQPGGGPGSGGCVDYTTDTTYKNNQMAEFLKWVDTYKDNPGVLMWDVGNESVLGMQNCYSGDQLEAERNAYTTFVNDVAKQIHAHDPNHPVTSTDAWTGAWPYFKKNAPDLDLYAVNSYGDVCNVKKDWEDGGYTKPYILTEAGPPGDWEVPDDANGIPDEPTDVQKAADYQSSWKCITGHTGVALGATMFHYGIENDYGGIWFNLLPGGKKRLSYYAVKQMYGGQGQDNTPPVISDMSVDNASNVPAGSTFTVKADIRDPDGDAVTSKVLLSSYFVDGNKALTDASFTDNGGGSFTVTAPKQLGVWKVYIQSEDGHGNAGIETKSFKVTPPPVQGTNVALNKTATASSYQQQGDGAPFPPSNTTDGKWDTRWASDWSDPQWLEVDLGQSTAFHHVQLGWESAYGKAYQIQTSENGTDWTTVYGTSSGTGGVETLDASGTGRYVRLNLTQRGTGYGYSLYEFGVYS